MTLMEPGPPKTGLPHILLLDFGAVISRTLFETHAHTENVLGLPAGTLTWRGPLAPETDPLWRAMQRDEITERNYWERRAREVGALAGEAGWTPMTLMQKARQGMSAAQVVRPEAAALVRQIAAAGLKAGILSNELALFFGPTWRSELPIMDQMTHIIDASDGGPLKPDPAAFERAVHAFGEPARAFVFVDDQARNVEGARAFGMTAIHFDVCDPAGSFAATARAMGLAEAPGARQIAGEARRHA